MVLKLSSMDHPEGPPLPDYETVINGPRRESGEVALLRWSAPLVEDPSSQRFCQRALSHL